LVVIVEKENHFGGNSAKASSGINALELSLNPKDSIDEFKKDTIKSKGGLNNELVDILIRGSEGII